MRRMIVLLAVAVFVSACAGGDEDGATSTPAPTVVPSTSSTAPTATPVTTTGTEPEADDVCAHVTDVTIATSASGFTVSATVRSADTGWEKYADAWEVRTTSGAVLGVRELAHPHETEQPFTRSLTGVEIPPDVTEVVVAARDSVAGFCGDEYVAEVPQS